MVDVLEFYNTGNPAPIQDRYVGVGRDSLIPKPSPLLKPINLTREEIDAVIAFMETLSSKTQRVNVRNMPQ